MKAVITGASKGIGRAIAEVFFQNGFDLAICSRTIADLEAFKKELQPKNPKQEIIIKAVDVSKKSGSKSLCYSS